MFQIGDIKEFGKAYGFKNHPNFRLHYLIFSQKSPLGTEGFSCAGLELGFFSWSESIIGAREELFNLYQSYLEREDQSTDAIFYQLANPNSDHMWAYYRQLSFAYGEPVNAENKYLKEEVIAQRILLEKQSTTIGEQAQTIAEVSEELMYEKISTDALRTQLNKQGTPALDEPIRS